MRLAGSDGLAVCLAERGSGKYPGAHAVQAPDQFAAVMTGTGESMTCAGERRSVHLAHVLHDAELTTVSRRSCGWALNLIRSGSVVASIVRHMVAICASTTLMCRPRSSRPVMSLAGLRAAGSLAIGLDSRHGLSPLP